MRRRDPELPRLAQECSRLIEREVATLAALVNEFSQFVRFPIAKLAPTDANTIVHERARGIRRAPRWHRVDNFASPRIFPRCGPMAACSAAWSST